MTVHRKRDYTSRVISKEAYGAKVYFLNLKLKEPKSIRFDAGQFVNIDVGGGICRQYSIASSPHKQHSIDLLVDISPRGPGSKYFERIGIGAHVKFKAPMGRFTLVQETGNIVFLSASTGIAPFKSIMDYLFEEQARAKDYQKRHIYLYQTFRHENEIFWNDYFENMEQENPNFHYLLTLTKSKPSWGGCRGYVQSFIDKQLLKSTKSNFYICGGSKMVEGVLSYLRENKVKEKYIHFEPF